MDDPVKIALIAGLCAAAPPTAASVVAVILGVMNKKELVEVKHNTNSLTANLVQLEKAVSFREGEASEKAREDGKP